ncbi:MAG: hypothetical protein DUD39_18120 [Coriobacteriaceae bacterium]|nr:MAG: hypothetical protein DUD39_18120 [Coriobacteriaceae bacterium]
MLPKRRADERRRRCRAKRRLSDPALTQKVRLLIMDRHWSLEQIDDISGSRVVAGASLSLPTILTGRSVAATLDLPGSGPQGQVRRHLRSKRPKTRDKIEILHSVKERPKRPMRGLASESGQTTRSWQRTRVPACACRQGSEAACREKMLPRQRECLQGRGRATTGTSPRDAHFRIETSSSQGIQGSQMPFEACSSTSATPTIYGRS